MAVSIKTGSYTGDGTTSKAITGLGFQIGTSANVNTNTDVYYSISFTDTSIPVLPWMTF